MLARAEFISLNNVPTFVRTWGKWIEEPLDEVRELILVIPGNPGVTSFYTCFLTQLYENLNREIPIWIVGHVGHEEESANSMPSLKGNKDLFNIDGQIRSKVAFIEKFIPSHIKVHLIGHSFGTCQSLDLIRNPKIKKQIQKCYLLFPTFERRKGTKSAKSFDKMYTFYNLIGFALAILFSKIPRILRVFIFSIYLMVKGTDLEYVDSYVMAAETGVMEKSLYLTNESNETYKELDVDLLRSNKDLFFLYYSLSDGWIKPNYYTDIQERVPGIEIQLDELEMEHMFLFKSSKEMAHILEIEIRENQIKD